MLPSAFVPPAEEPITTMSSTLIVALWKSSERLSNLDLSRSSDTEGCQRMDIYDLFNWLDPILMLLNLQPRRLRSRSGACQADHRPYDNRDTVVELYP
jgi:hypothetical protein